MTDTTLATTVSCNHCGAPLRIQSTTNFATCGYCGAQLEIKRAGGAVYTEILRSIDSRTQRIEQDVNHIKRQNQLEQLDREWMLRREQYMTQNKDGSRSVPGPVGGIVAAVIAVIFGVIWMAGAASAGAPAPFVLFGLLFIAVAIVGAITGIGRSARYVDAERAYLRQRDDLLRNPDDRANASAPFNAGNKNPSIL
jgi:hypothetical protein